MTTYTIEEGIPIPRCRGGARGMGGPRTEWTKTVTMLQPGQSVLTDRFTDYKAAQNLILRMKPSKYAIRKIGGQGWRVWRVE